MDWLRKWDTLPQEVRQLILHNGADMERFYTLSSGGAAGGAQPHPHGKHARCSWMQRQSENSRFFLRKSAKTFEKKETF